MYSDESEWSEEEDEETQRQQAAVWAQLVSEKVVKKETTTLACTCGLIPCLCSEDNNVPMFSLPASFKERPGLLLNPDTRDDSAEYLSAQISEKLKPHQMEGVRFLWQRVIEPRSEDARGCILADHMGLGKTLQLIATISTYFQTFAKGTVLVIAPAFVLGNWQAEILKWTGENTQLANELNVRTLGTGPNTRAGRLAIIDAWRKDGGTLLVGYEMFRHLVLRGSSTSVSTKTKKKKRKQTEIDQDVRICNTLISPGLLILDEAHRLKDPRSQVYKALSRITTKRRILASGYPIQNRLDEYWALCDFARPGVLGNYDSFRSFFERTIESYVQAQSNFQDTQILGTNATALINEINTEGKEALQRAYALQYALNDVVLRRGIEQLGTDLPPRTDWLVHCKLGQIQQELYQAFCAFNKNSIGELATYHATLAIVNHPDIIHLALEEEDDALNNNTFDQDVFPISNINQDTENDDWFVPELEESKRKRLDSQRERTEKKRAKILQKLKAKNRTAADEIDIYYDDNQVEQIEEDDDDENNAEVSAACWSQETELGAWARPVLRNESVPYVIGQSTGQHGSGKAIVAIEIILAATRRKERVVLFTQTLGTLDVLERLLKSHPIRVARVDGATALTKRTNLIAALNNDEHKTKPKYTPSKKKAKRTTTKLSNNNGECDVLLMSIKAGGEGINLIGASRVILFDVCWNPCFDQQALSRAHRFGQTRHVHVYRLVGPDGTMEDRVLRQQRRKELLVRQVADVGTHRENEPYLDLKKVYPSEQISSTQDQPTLADDLLTEVIHNVGSAWISKIHQSILEDPTLSSRQKLLADADKTQALEDYKAFIAAFCRHNPPLAAPSSPEIYAD